jgi:hypothetical protein
MRLVIEAFISIFRVQSMDDEASVEFDLPAADALGRLDVVGKLRAADHCLYLHWKLRDRTFTRTQNKLRTIELTMADIEKLHLDKGWFKTLLSLEVKDPRLLDAMPGAEIGKLQLNLPKSARAEADKLVSVVDFELSQWRADRSDQRLRELEEQQMSSL